MLYKTIAKSKTVSAALGVLLGDDAPHAWNAVLLRPLQEFWDTRVEGSAEVWATLRMAAEMIESDSGDGENVSTAKAILEVTPGQIRPSSDRKSGQPPCSRGRRLTSPRRRGSSRCRTMSAAMSTLSRGGRSWSRSTSLPVPGELRDRGSR